MWKKWLLGNLDGFPLASLRRVFHLIAGVEPGEWCEGVDPGAAWAWEGPHEAGDAAQGGDGLWWQRWVHQQVWHQVPGLIDDWQIHAIASRRALKTCANATVNKLLQHKENSFSLSSLYHFSLLSSGIKRWNQKKVKGKIRNMVFSILFFNLLLERTLEPGTYRGMGQTILLGLICVIETQGGSSGKAFITVTVISWHVFCFPNTRKVPEKSSGIPTCKSKQMLGQNIASDEKKSQSSPCSLTTAHILNLGVQLRIK